MTLPSAERWPLPGPSDPKLLTASTSKRLLDRPEVQRLRGMRLLGALDYLEDRPFHTRWEHSVAVAIAAETLGQTNEMNPAELETLSAAALLHDIGHAPLSHTLHDLLEQTFHISHQQLGIDLVLGERQFPTADIPLDRFLGKCGIKPYIVASLMKGEGDLGGFLCGSFGIDTLDAIPRVAQQHGLLKRELPFDLTTVLASDSQTRHADLERFWRLKDSFYQSVVYSDRALVFERIVSLTAIPSVLDRGADVALLAEPDFVELIDLNGTVEKFRSLWEEMEVVRGPEYLAEVRQVIRHFVPRSSNEGLLEFGVEPEERIVRVNREIFAELAGLARE